MTAWIGMGEAGKLMGMTPKGAKLRLQRLQEQMQIRFLRKLGGRWEVNAEILKQLNSYPEDYVDEQLEGMRAKISEVNHRVTALRDVGKKFRKKTEKRLSEHDKQLEALKQLAEAANMVARTFQGSM